jgi:predicted Zn-dependent protease
MKCVSTGAMKRGLAAVLAGSVLALTGAMGGGCETNAATGRSQLVLMSKTDEVALGVQAQPELIKEFGGKVGDSVLQKYVADVGKKLAAQTEADNPGLPWEFTFLNSDDVNAFALPGGKIFITRGLASKMKDEAELAHVLGHEVGHVTARHTNERMSQAMGAEILAGVAGAAAKDEKIAEVASQVAELVLLSYSRDQESEADSLGMRYMTRAGWDPAGAEGVMKILINASQGERPPEMLATHPDPELRLERVRRELSTVYRGVTNNPKYVRNEQRFRSQFLTRLRALRAQEGVSEEEANRRAIASIGHSGSWCAHCAAAERKEHEDLRAAVQAGASVSANMNMNANANANANANGKQGPTAGGFDDSVGLLAR